MPIYYGNQKIKPHGIKEAYYGSQKIYSASRLPSAYQEVEYIQGSGSAYIDLGVNSRSSLTIIADMQNPNDLGNEVMISGGDSWDSNFLQMGLGCWTNFDGQIYKTNYLGIKTRVILKLDDFGFYINNELKQAWTPTTWNSNYNLYAFVSNQGGSLQLISQEEKLFKLEILENGVHIRNFIPCYRKSDNEIGLYDLVNNQFYTNQGSGTFRKGNDI